MTSRGLEVLTKTSRGCKIQNNERRLSYDTQNRQATQRKFENGAIEYPNFKSGQRTSRTRLRPRPKRGRNLFGLGLTEIFRNDTKIGQEIKTGISNRSGKLLLTP